MEGGFLRLLFDWPEPLQRTDKAVVHLSDGEFFADEMGSYGMRFIDFAYVNPSNQFEKNQATISATYILFSDNLPFRIQRSLT